MEYMHILKLQLYNYTHVILNVTETYIILQKKQYILILLHYMVTMATYGSLHDV